MSRWLVACEESGTVRDAFLRRGIDAVSCDLKPTRSQAFGKHYQCDVRELLYSERWAGIIAHPTCTYLSNSGVRWLTTPAKDPAILWGAERRLAMLDAAKFFLLFWNYPDRDMPICVENPVMHKHALALIGGERHTQTVQPYQFGHLESKRTCFWLRNLPPLLPTHDVEAAMRELPERERSKVHYCSPGEKRAEIRSTFFTGIADAMAVQWGPYGHD